MQKISDENGSSSDHFGGRVSISGDYIIIGAYDDDIGEKSDQGCAHIYLRLGLGWQKLQLIIDPAGFGNDNLGTAVSIDGSTQRFLLGDHRYAQNSGKVIFGKVN